MQTSQTPASVQRSEFVKGFDLPLKSTFFPLGFPLQIETNSCTILDAARESWGHFRMEFADAEPVHLSTAVAGTGETAVSAPPAFHSHEHLMTIVSDQNNQIVCDFRRGRAAGWLTRAMAENRPTLRRHFLESSVMSMLAQAHLAPLHGALVSRNGRGILLCGPSLAGKSTLAFACARAGWHFVSDDAAFLVRNHPGAYGVGNPHTISLRADIKHAFAELADRRLSIRPGGKVEIEVRTSELPIVLAQGSPINHVVFLDRARHGAVRLEPCDADDVSNWCDAHANFGEDYVRQAQRRTYRRLLAAGLWRMHYDDCDRAIALLAQLDSPIR